MFQVFAVINILIYASGYTCSRISLGYISGSGIPESWDIWMFVQDSAQLFLQQLVPVYMPVSVCKNYHTSMSLVTFGVIRLFDFHKSNLHSVYFYFAFLRLFKWSGDSLCGYWLLMFSHLGYACLYLLPICLLEHCLFDL